MEIFAPNIKDLAKGTAVNLAFRFGMQTAKPFEPSQYIGNEGNPTITELTDLEGRPWLTSLALSFGNKTIIFEECIISLNLEKIIVSTVLQGRTGAIKEYITDGDYQITVTAAISNYHNKEDSVEASFTYPEDQLNKLKELLILPETLVVQSDFLQLFGINAAVVTSFSLEQETHSNRQSIQIQMLSDQPYEIKLKEDL
jgi:hypothetical protein|nr:MAG TPA: hypothetical protein [Caudoviricetes sp.]